MRERSVKTGASQRHEETLLLRQSCPNQLDALGLKVPPSGAYTAIQTGKVLFAVIIPLLKKEGSWLAS
jgi:hypothetical protein